MRKKISTGLFLVLVGFAFSASALACEESVAECHFDQLIYDRQNVFTDLKVEASELIVLAQWRERGGNRFYGGYRGGYGGYGYGRHDFGRHRGFHGNKFHKFNGHQGRFNKFHGRHGGFNRHFRGY